MRALCSSTTTRTMTISNVVSGVATRTTRTISSLVVPLCAVLVTTTTTTTTFPVHSCHAFSLPTKRTIPNFRSFGYSSSSFLLPQPPIRRSPNNHHNIIVGRTMLKSRNHQPPQQHPQQKYFSTTCLTSSSTDNHNDNDNDNYDITEVMRQESMMEMKALFHYFDTTSPNHNHTQNASTTTTTTTTTITPLLFQTPQDVSDYIHHHIDTILFDCDGVLYRGTDPIPDAVSTLSKLQKAGKQIFFVTNNAASTRQQLRDKLAQLLQCPQLEKEQMIGSAYSAACYLQQTLWKKNPDEDNNNKSTTTTTKHVHVIGAQGLYEEIANLEHVQVTGGPLLEKEPAGMSREELAAYPFSPYGEKVDAVVIGLDTEFTYRKLCIATVLLQRNPQAVLIATNRDAYDLVGMDSRHLPGNGALVAALEVASQRQAINVGKPSPVLASLIAQEYNLNPSRTLMVGDRLDTDVKFGIDGGMKSALVMTGCTTATKIQSLVEAAASSNLPNEEQDEPMPTMIFPHMGMMSVR